MRFSKVAAVAVFVLVSASAHAAELFVSTSGNDANAGTASSPLRTLGRAAAIAQPGDVVNVRGGIYTGAVSMASKGTASARITFRSYPGETAVLDGTGLGSTTILLNLSRTEYVDVTGFEIRNAPYIAVNARNVKSTRLAGNSIHHAFRNGIYVGADSMGGSTDIVIENNSVTNNVLENQNHTSSGGWAGAVVVSRTNGGTISGNRIWNNDGEAIIGLLSNNLTIRGNQTWDNFSHGVYLDNARFTTVDGNLIYSTGNTRYFRDGYPGQGIAVANETYTDTNPSSDNTIVNNIVVGTRWGFYYGSFENGGGLRNTRVANNTFHDTAQEIIRIATDTHAGSVVENNIFYGGSGTTYAGGGVAFRNNNWYGVNAGVAAGIGDVYGNPGFVNAGGFTAADYRLTAGSAAITTAADLTSIVTTDYFGALRVVPFDIGAHEYSSTAVTDTQAPSAPSSLRPVNGGSTSITIAWNSSTDNVAVTGYTVYRDGAAMTNVSGTSWSDGSVVAGRLYNYSVVAFDAAGNRSVASNVLSVAWTETEGSTDTQAPSVPSSLTVTGVTSTSISLSWTPSTDDTGVTGYQIYQDGVHVATTAGNAWSAVSLESSRTYTYSVQAVDAAGNASSQSAPVNATTRKATKRRSA